MSEGTHHDAVPDARQAAFANSDNELILWGPELVAVEYVPGSLSIDPEKNARGVPSVSRRPGSWLVSLDCKRENHRVTGDRYRSVTGGSGHITPGGMPDNLNFSFALKLGFDCGSGTITRTVYFAQGHTGLHNPWYAGSPDLSSGGEAELSVVDPARGAHFLFVAGRPQRNQFSFVRSRANWMENLHDNTPLGDVNLPGTHDSAAINHVVVTPYSCHYGSLTKQLLSGIRVLDIRLSLRKSGGKYVVKTCHGDHGLGKLHLNEYQSFSSALDECAAFLRERPSESLVMSLKVDDWGEGVPRHDAGALEAVKDELRRAPFLPPGSRMPTVGEARGRILLFNRINEDPGLGVPLPIPDNTDGVLLPVTGLRGFTLFVQDRYEKLGGSTSVEKKIELFFGAIRSVRETVPAPGVLFNFASGVCGPSNLEGVYIHRPLLAALGSKLPGAGSDARPGRPGWCLFDYEDRVFSTMPYGDMTVVDILIDSNVFKQAPGGRRYLRYPDRFSLV